MAKAEKKSLLLDGDKSSCKLKQKLHRFKKKEKRIKRELEDQQAQLLKTQVRQQGQQQQQTVTGTHHEGTTHNLVCLINICRRSLHNSRPSWQQSSPGTQGLYCNVHGLLYAPVPDHVIMLSLLQTLTAHDVLYSWPQVP